jgi:hypothetical protein
MRECAEATFAAAGRPADDDHYGTALAFRFGGPDDLRVAKIMNQSKVRTGCEARDYFAMGDAAVIMERIATYGAAGASKFISQPPAAGDTDMSAWTTHLVHEVLPLVAARWPKPAKVPPDKNWRNRQDHQDFTTPTTRCCRCVFQPCCCRGGLPPGQRWKWQELQMITNATSRPLAIGEAVGRTEQRFIDLVTNRVYRLRRHHPWLYGLLAFVIGSAVVALFTMSTYKSWSFVSIDLTTAFYQVLLGGLGGGIALMVLAFSHTRTIEPTLVPMRDQGIIGSRE